MCFNFMENFNFESKSKQNLLRPRIRRIVLGTRQVLLKTEESAGPNFESNIFDHKVPHSI